MCTVVFNSTLVPGSGAVKMAISVGLHACTWAVTGVEVGPFYAVADVLKVISSTLVQIAGGNAIHTHSALRGSCSMGATFAWTTTPPAHCA